MSDKTTERLPPVVHVNPPRTDEQKFADMFDCDLYRLLSRAETMADKRGATQQRWIDAARSLRMARALIRGLMHPTDRAATHD